MNASDKYTSDEFLRVNSCSRQTLSERDYVMFRKNGRSDYHILYITRGCCTVKSGGKDQIVNAGGLILFKPHEPQIYSFRAEDNTVSCYIHFCGKDCKSILTRAGLYDNRVTYIGVSHTLDTIFTQLSDEFALHRPFYEDICASLLLRFISVAGRKLNYEQNHIKTGSVYTDIDNICKKMHTEYYKPISVKEYAKMCNLSYDRFAHVFKERIGCSPKSYILRIRVNKACELLSQTNLSISEASEAVGIDDANYFSRIVKKYTGHPPKYFKTL